MGDVSEDTVVSMAFLVAGVVLLILGIRYLLMRRAARAWPIVTGQVDSTKMRIQRTSGTQSIHVGEVFYTYIVNGVRYQGRWRRKTVLWHRNMRNWLNAYPLGGSLSIRYNPVKAKTSTVFLADQRSAQEFGPLSIFQWISKRTVAR